jgi:two-component system, chemotaxis family, response regulator Rcp1
VLEEETNMASISKPIDVLMVEDNPDDVFLTKEALAETKLLVNLHVAEDGEEALAFLRQEGEHSQTPTPDLILLDLNLPKMDGRELLDIIKQDPALRVIPVVVLTTSEADEDIVRAYTLHANCYITKPVSLDQFLEVVSSIEDFWLTIVKLPTGRGK